MTEPLYLQDAYAREATGRVQALEGGGVVLERSLFYATGGGQPGDSGTLGWEGGEMAVATCEKGEGGALVLIPGEGSQLPAPGSEVIQRIDWDRRHRHMRLHTALHLLSVVIPLPVTGGALSGEKGRLDFAMPDPPSDKPALEAALNELIARDLTVQESWIGDEELAARPQLVKTMRVQPPRGAGRVRLVRIGTPEEQIDLQPCGGTHVARTGEIGRVRLGKIEKKGRLNRRVYIHLEKA